MDQNVSLTAVTLECGVCGDSYSDLVPLVALTDERERCRCAAIQLPICFRCEAQVENVE
jgi:hypothetical protein